MDLNLSNRTAVVTGASKGIGLAVTRTLLEEGARVVAASRTRTEELDALDGEIVHVQADLSHPDSPGEVMARAAEQFGGLDVLVNNLGGAPPGVDLPHTSFFHAADEDWKAIFDLNLFSAVRASRAAIPLLLEGGGGAIVNVSSVNGRRPFPNPAYAGAKAAMTALTKSLSEEFGGEGLRVNTVSPGPVNTPWWTDQGGAADVLSERTGMEREGLLTTAVPEMMQLTTGRLAEPQEVADVVALLASPRSASTTGAEFVVDSGFLKEL
jgi:NAD(P)-dependent dehydrogenase (short-subunit alcohol dehydrogenase family)